MSTTVEIILCPSCKGKGYILTDILVDYHKREYDTERSDCRSCKGSGRMKKKTVVTCEAFKCDT